MFRRNGRKTAVLMLFVLTATFFLTMLPIANQEAQAAQVATVTGDRVNIRTGPSTSYAIVVTVSKGTKLDVLKSSNGWYNVRLANGKVGWIAGWLVSVQNVQAPSQVSTQKVAVVNVSTANIRSGPGLNYGRVAYGYRGNRFNIIGQQGTWYKIKLTNGRQAWISNTVIRVENVTTQPSQPAPTTSVAEKVTVNVATLNVRSGPNTTYAIVGRVVKGNVLTVITKSNNWYKVSLPNGKQGWVAGWLVTKQETPQNSEPSPPSEPSEATKSLVISGASWVNIRKGPGTNYAVMTTLPEGTEMIGLRQSNNWHNVRLKDGREGWIIATYVKEQATAPVQDKPLEGKVIVVDPGHSSINSWGIDPGASGATGLTERVVVLDISLKLRDILTSLGAKVIMTHTGTTTLSLQGRADVANNANADLFVSVHANANTNPTINGTSVYYYVNSDMSSTLSTARAKLAQSIQTEMLALMQTKDNKIRTANFKVIVATKMPSVLVETAFLTNPREEALLATEAFRLKCAQGIALGIERYFE